MYYEYECPDHGVIEVEQKMSDDALTLCPKCKEEGKSSPVKRLISLSTFHLAGGGWSSNGYS